MKVIATLVALISICTHANAQSHDRDWYCDHEAERKAVKAKCDAAANTIKTQADMLRIMTPDCMAAKDAAGAAFAYGKSACKKNSKFEPSNPSITGTR
jgi:hypothetical protein